MWLNAHGYGKYGYERTDLMEGGAYGGKNDDSDSVDHYPVVFFHGNSDIAVGKSSIQTGFTKTIQTLISKGYKKSELYITTWGPGTFTKGMDQVHSQETLNYLRQFTEAVLAYTGAKKISVISHSMGVTLARRVIKGGVISYEGPPFDLGHSLGPQVDTFIGIAGGNWGIANCLLGPVLVPTCNANNGYFPGVAIGPIGLSSYLRDLNNDEKREGDHVFAIFAYTDEMAGYGGLIYGRFTSLWPTVDKS